MSTVQEKTVLNRLRTRGYWRVVIRPTSFQKNRVPLVSDLFPIIEKNSVQLRGWDYPHVDLKSSPLRGADWVGQEFEWQDEIEVWRFYKSGQFIHYFAIAGEWRDHSTMWTAEAGWKPGRFLYYIATIYSVIEIFEFAARLARSPSGASFMHVGIELEGLLGRRIVSTDIMVPVNGTYVTQMAEWKYSWEGAHTQLIAQPRELAAVATREHFEGFGLDLSLEIIARLQARIGR
jgi:hypothetical protein